jgi:hypothetical protein
MWREMKCPTVVLEFTSGDGSTERDRTPDVGTFAVYERHVKADFYGIYDLDPGRAELYALGSRGYERVAPNTRGNFPIPPLDVELGIWRGTYFGQTLPWLRWWAADGDLLLTGSELAEHERPRTEIERRRAELLAFKLRGLGIDPDVE